ncbi:MAG: hypothetical protein HY788_01890 [Deltaproteobacteria bacterium]|nr:hypothetical protein [Deltaproteobacteria bacterium]
MPDRNRFQKLRTRHPYFRFKRFRIEDRAQHLDAAFEFELSPNIRFTPEISIVKPPEAFVPVPEHELENLVFHLGMIELISYWKCACPGEIIIECGRLDETQQAWWKDLFINGLGEFFFVNQIDFRDPHLLEFRVPEGPSSHVGGASGAELEGSLIPIGGGKDTVVTLEILKEMLPRSWAFMLNPTPAMIETAEIAGFPRERFLTIRRAIHPTLLRLNDEGYLNGHTPFSAYLGFLGVLCARLVGCRNIIVSNEKSSDVGNTRYLGKTVNHQYSKSLEFERKFSAYVRTYLHPEIRYFSLLRDLDELRIAEVFSHFPKYFDAFKSCNVGRSTDRWCGSCSKCLFVYTMLSPFLSEETLSRIFGGDLFSMRDLLPTLKQLVGEEGLKPFDCVGTENETRQALGLALKKRSASGKPLPALLEYAKTLAPLQGEEEAWDVYEAALRGGTGNTLPQEFADMMRTWMP